MFELLVNLQSMQMCVTDVSTHITSTVVCYPVALGKETSPTPLGKFKIIRAVSHPQFVSCKTGVNHGSGFLGTYALVTDQLTSDGCPMAIHGTSKPSLIGQEVSEGCIRMFNSDINHLVNNFLPNLSRGEVVGGINQ